MVQSRLPLRRILDQQEQGYSLDKGFYTDPSIFDAELDVFLKRHWINAGHISRIPDKGDHFLFEFAGFELIIVRTGSSPDDVAALNNVCRHRGAKICEARQGNTSLFTCRYHAWSYGLDGRLTHARHMRPDFDKSKHSLVKYGSHVFLGSIFVSLDPQNAPDFDELVVEALPFWQRFDLHNTVIAHREIYELNANWKLAVENNLECYHCMPSHPEYTRMHGFVRSDERASESAVSEFAAYRMKWDGRMRSLGRPIGFSEMKESRGQSCRTGTWPLKDGVLTGSADGQGVAPLLGSIPAYDESVTAGFLGYLSYIAAYCDYARVLTYVPQSSTRTRIELTWLVRAGSRPDVDYDREGLTWLWDVTTRQDKDIIELNAKGVASSGYVPGPYSNLEWLAAEFVEHYKSSMKSGIKE